MLLTDGFRKVVSNEAVNLKVDRDDMEFAHQYFLQGQERLLEFIKRKVVFCVMCWLVKGYCADRTVHFKAASNASDADYSYRCSQSLSVSLCVTRLKLVAARAVYAACHVRGVIQCSLRQMPLAPCMFTYKALCRLLLQLQPVELIVYCLA